MFDKLFKVGFDWQRNLKRWSGFPPMSSVSDFSFFCFLRPSRRFLTRPTMQDLTIPKAPLLSARTRRRFCAEDAAAKSTTLPTDLSVALRPSPLPLIPSPPSTPAAKASTSPSKGSLIRRGPSSIWLRFNLRRRNFTENRRRKLPGLTGESRKNFGFIDLEAVRDCWTDCWKDWLCPLSIGLVVVILCSKGDIASYSLSAKHFVPSFR